MENDFKLKTEPWEHQLKALEYLYSRNSAALYTKPGSGKTKIMIDLIVNRGFQRVLVVAPKKPSGVWPKEIQLHSDIPKENVYFLSNMSTEEKVKLLSTIGSPKKGETLIFICNYESVWREPLKRIWFYKRIGLDCVICDESHRIKSPGSKCSCFLSTLGRHVLYRYLMTGTPLAENPMDVYAQYRFLDPTIFGTNYGAFCAEYQNLDPIVTAKVGFPVLDKKQPYKNLDKLREKMFSCAFYMKPVIKLPKTIRKVKKVPMDAKTEAIYKELSREGSVIDGDGYMTVNNALAMIIRKQQVTSGYLPLEYDDGSSELKRISTYRRTYLYKLLQEIPEDEPVVIFAKFKKDLYAIRKVSERLGRAYSEISGSADGLKEWQEGQTQILGVQYTAGSEGINLTRSHICIFYTLDHSLGKYEQALKRIHRPGQTKPCIYYHMVAVMSSGETVDQKILRCLKEKKEYINLVIRGVESV